MGVNWSNLGKKRSKFGKWLDERGISQADICKVSGINKATISTVASDPECSLHMSTVRKIMKAVKKYDSNVEAKDFWDI